jgi:carnitine-CoA ligase
VPAASGSPGESDVVLAVVPRAGAPFDPAALVAHLEAHLEPNFVPSFLQVLDEIPKTISEKPQVRFLEERLGAAGAVVHRSDTLRGPGRSAHGA